MPVTPDTLVTVRADRLARDHTADVRVRDIVSPRWEAVGKGHSYYLAATVQRSVLEGSELLKAPRIRFDPRAHAATHINVAICEADNPSFSVEWTFAKIAGAKPRHHRGRQSNGRHQQHPRMVRVPGGGAKVALPPDTPLRARRCPTDLASTIETTVGQLSDIHWAHAENGRAYLSAKIPSEPASVVIIEQDNRWLVTGRAKTYETIAQQAGPRPPPISTSFADRRAINHMIDAI